MVVMSTIDRMDAKIMGYNPMNTNDYSLCSPMAYTEDYSFFETLGERIAQNRQDIHLTQAKMAELLGISQQQYACFETGKRKIPASLLVKLANIFGTTTDSLLGNEKKPQRRGPTPKLLQQIEQVSRMPQSKQKLVIEMLDAIIQQYATGT